MTETIMFLLPVAGMATISVLQQDLIGKSQGTKLWVRMPYAQESKALSTWSVAMNSMYLPMLSPALNYSLAKDFTIVVRVVIFQSLLTELDCWRPAKHHHRGTLLNLRQSKTSAIRGVRHCFNHYVALSMPVHCTELSRQPWLFIFCVLCIHRHQQFAISDRGQF